MPLPRPTTDAGRTALSAILAAPGSALVAADYDGTLAPIVADPAQAAPFPGAVEALAAVARRVGTAAVLTGRPAATAVALGGLDAVPGLIVLGHYGLERWEGGRVAAPPPHPGLDLVRKRLPELLAAAAGRTAEVRGTAVEDKGRAVAVHTRRAAGPQAALDALAEPLAALAAAAGLAVEPGRFVVELRPSGMDKGAALAALVRERGARSLLYAGDDLGDLAAFSAVARLRDAGGSSGAAAGGAGGAPVPGLAVCSGSSEVAELAARADLVVDGPAGMTALLSSLAEAVGPAPPRR